MRIDSVSECLYSHEYVKSLLCLQPEEISNIQKIIARANVDSKSARNLVDLHSAGWKPLPFNDAKRRAIFAIYMQKAFKHCLS